MLLILPHQEASAAFLVGSCALGLSVLYGAGKLYDLVSKSLQMKMKAQTDIASFGLCYIQ